MKNHSVFPSLLFLLVSLFLLPACTSVEKLVDNGNYEETIRLAQRKLSGKQKKNPKYVAALEEAFNRVTARDMATAERLKNGGNADWPRIHGIYQKIDRRQRALEPLLPLTDKRGYRAEFSFVRVTPLLTTAANRAADQLYGEAGQLLAHGRAGDKAAARNAYATLEDISTYRRDYRDANALQREARELGKVFIAVEMVNETNGYLPAGFERELLRVNSRGMDSYWHFFDFSRETGKAYDYNARIVIDDIRVSPEQINERTYVDEREITDGEEYVLDANGNVAKDTLGNDITRPRRVIVRANVIEVLQTKTALVSGSLVLYDNVNRRIVDEDALTAEARFENYASTFRGDRRALSRDTRRWIGNQPVSFPSDEALILDAAAVLKPQLQERLADSYAAR
ncbi:MAG: hypothetical protein AAFN92_04510 [Bacteroidota bacterium]